jgi:hypothetical protein
VTVVLVAFQNFKRVLCTRGCDEEEHHHQQEPQRSSSQLLNRTRGAVESGRAKEKENNMNLLNRGGK